MTDDNDYIELPVDGWTVVRTSNLTEIERDKARLDWLERQYECKDSWDDVWMRQGADLRKVIDTVREAE